jgi:hypothetical protein
MGLFQEAALTPPHRVSSVPKFSKQLDLIHVEAVTGLSEAYSFGPEFAAPLSVIAIALTGDPVAGTWSIGGPYPAALGRLLSTPERISLSHNAYESDASPARVSLVSKKFHLELANKH